MRNPPQSSSGCQTIDDVCVRVDWLVGAGGTQPAVSLCIDFYSLGHNLLSFREVCPFSGILPARVDSPALCVSLSWDILLPLALVLLRFECATCVCLPFWGDLHLGVFCEVC